MTSSLIDSRPPADFPFGIAESCEPLVRRVLAPNPSPYTYSGTQTYLVGNGRDVAVIDPGPITPHRTADAPDYEHGDGHVEAIQEAIGNQRLIAIMCTHTHRDHSPASRTLAAATGAPIIGCAPLFMAADGLPRSDESFDADYAPDQVLANGDQVIGDGFTLTAVHTPGHTSNHLCYALEESGALFTGDHVMAWSTSVIVPPDGNMSDYLASMQRLYERDDRIYYPAHGRPITNTRQLVRGMIGHRRQRERQIVKLLEGGPQVIPAMVTAMYKGLDPRLVGAAGQSVRAHLIDLEQRGLARVESEIWSLIQ